jgi:FtsH-binding integral membrane protein
MSSTMAWGDAGVIALIVGLVGYLAANRLGPLRRYRGLFPVLGVLLFLVGIYVDWQNVKAGFVAGWDYVRPTR